MATTAPLASADELASRPRNDGRAGEVSRLEWLLLAGVVLVAAIARFYRLDTSLWFDEINTLVDFVRLPTAALVQSLKSNNHMFYSLQAQAAIALLSESPWSLRLPAALFGVASVVAIWALARRAAGPVEALVAAFLLAISVDHVSFSQSARGYTGLLFWTTCASLLFARGLAGAGRRTWTLYAVCMAAASYTHLSALFVLLCHGIVYVAALAVLRARPEYAGRGHALAGARGWPPLFGLALGAALTLLLYAPVLAQIADVVRFEAVDPSTPGEWRNPARMPQNFAVTLWGLGRLTPFVIAAGAVAFVTGVQSLARRAPVITALYVLHIPLVALLLLALHARIWPRFFLVDIGFIYVAVVHGTFVLCRHLARRVGGERGGVLPARILTGMAVIVMTAGSLWLLARNYAHPKQDFAGSVAYVERERGPHDAVAALGEARAALRLYAPNWRGVSSVAELDTVRQSAPRTWVVVRNAPPPPFGNIIASDFELVARFPGTLPYGDMVIYRSR